MVTTMIRLNNESAAIGSDGLNNNALYVIFKHLWLLQVDNNNILVTKCYSPPSRRRPLHLEISFHSSVLIAGFVTLGARESEDGVLRKRLSRGRLAQSSDGENARKYNISEKVSRTSYNYFGGVLL